MSGLRLQVGADAARSSTPAGRRERMTVGSALRKALGDFYEHSWRLVLLNSLLSVFALAFLAATQYLALPVALVLLAVALGPPALALVHCAVTVVQTGDLELADFGRGLRLHWRRGLALGALAAASIVLTAIAVGFYAGRAPSAWPLAFVVLYLAGLLGVFQLPLWPLAVVDRELPLRAVFRAAALAAARRPSASVGLGVSLLLVNVLGAAAAVLPFLTMTVAYSCLAAARFFVSNPTTED